MNLFHARLDREGIVLDINIDENIPLVMGKFQNLEQILINLLSNSRYALNKKYPERDNLDKMLNVVLESHADKEWPHVRLMVYDRGVGIPAEIVDKVLNPFVTTKPAGEGTGLGLHVCFNIVKQHNGRIDIASEPGEFTLVTVDLPTGES